MFLDGEAGHIRSYVRSGRLANIPRGVWGHAPTGKFYFYALKSILVRSETNNLKSKLNKLESTKNSIQLASW